jgi:DNA polymerase I-like protein with 3'-5' exonuclease and polymerase domains
MSQYDEKMPFVSRLSEFCQSRAEKRGFLRLIDGARVRFDRWEPRYLSKQQRDRGYREHLPMAPAYREEAQKRVDDPKHPWYREILRRAFCHKGMNWLIQGSAARQTKLAMRECWRMKILPLIQMHDELGIPIDNEKITVQIAEAMRDVVKLEVPVKVDSEFGPNWGDAKYKNWDELSQKYPLAA